MWRASFRTAYLQREVPVLAAVMCDNDLKVGCLVTYHPATATSVAYIEAVTANTEDAALAAATHFLAQSDDTMPVPGFGHVPVEYHDYQYADTVHNTVNLGTTGKKFVGVSDTVANLKTKFGGESNAVDDMAYVLADGKMYRCTVVGANGTWVEDSTASVDVKKIAMYPIIDKADLRLTDEE